MSDALTAATDQEDMFRPAKTINKDTRNRFWKFQQELSDVSMLIKDYPAAYEHLGVDPFKPTFRKVVLFVWHVVAVLWIALIEAS